MKLIKCVEQQGKNIQSQDEESLIGVGLRLVWEFNSLLGSVGKCAVAAFFPNTIEIILFGTHFY